MVPLCAHGDLTVMMMSFMSVSAWQVRPVGAVRRPPSSFWHKAATLTSCKTKISSANIFITSLSFPWIISWWAMKLLTFICESKSHTENSQTRVHKCNSATRCQHRPEITQSCCFWIHDNKVDNIAKHSSKRFKIRQLSFRLWDFQVRFHTHRVDWCLSSVSSD